jgi:CubicO group peptidase (beta-lactamase class C family)
MQLVEAGRIELDAPVRQYLPWFEVLPRDDAAKITVRHLLNQTSGLSLRDGRLDFDSRDDSDTALATGVRALAGARLRASPGESFEYTNANYNAAGAIVEAVSGQRFEQYIDSHVFAPLKMIDSFASRMSARQHGLGTGHQYWFGRLRPGTTTSRPSARANVSSGGLFSSAADLSRLLRVHLNGGDLDGERILSPEGMSGLHRPASFMTAKRHYAMGWIVQELNDGRKIVWHDGAGLGYASLIMLVPDEKWGFVFLVNASNQLSGPNVGALANEVRRLLMGQAPRPVRKAAGLFTPPLGALAVLLVVQLLAAVHTLQIARRWKRDPARRPRGRLRLTWHFVLPALAGMGVVRFLAFGLPRAADTNLSGVRLFAPDAGLLIVASVAFVSVWVPIRTVLLQRSMRDREEPNVSRTSPAAT